MPRTQTTAPAPTVTASPPATFEAARAMRTVRHLAGRIGPRLATGPAFREAAEWVADALRERGYDVRRQSFDVPAGDSWGVPVAAGRSTNVIATPADFDPDAPYVLVGAHLDTVAVAPGAEDNASGVAVLLELGRVLGGTGQVVLVAFGGEEPRGPGDLHHFGSTAYVAAMSPAERRHLSGMVAMDRVGVGAVVPLSSVAGTPTATRDRLARIGDGLAVPTLVETDAASDHESFADAGLPAARIGSTPYAGYHSAADVPAVVSPAQLRRVGELVTAWARRAS
ncbi:M28 family metallopeptidase [Nocardioides mangrovi]|uniref:M28 family peptidase n=1 Tax=Nocardioides mangrovi TaxID=2874580 RepID=A0ABS7UAN8_9ACTN|nr:M28 family peptidase [Nocardioides mangrovi]MBZ5738068.1 M28 family peptidase [Nocardioides mangrovi]